MVRQAGVYSLGRLAADRSFLAAAAIDNLSDMFNDEIEEVSITITSIKKDFDCFYLCLVTFIEGMS